MKIHELEAMESKLESNSFYVSFADLMMLLSVFFVLLLAMSKVETGLFEQVRSGILGSTKGTLVELSTRLKSIVNGDPGVPGVKVRMAKDGVRLDLDTAALFASGSAALKPGALKPLEPLLQEVLVTKYSVDIEGHSDDTKLLRMVGGEIETNWSLSGRRASAVVYHLMQFGFDKTRLRIVGFADTKPLVPIHKKRGKGLSAARAKNRRVSLLVK